MNQQLLYKTPRQIAEENKIYKENYSKGLHYPKTIQDKLWNEPKYDLNKIKQNLKNSLKNGFMSAKQDSINLQNQIIHGHKNSQLNAGFNFYNPGFLGSLGGVIGGWKELERTTLGSAGDTIDVTSLADKRYYMILADMILTGTTVSHIRLNADSGVNYATRLSANGATDATATPSNRIFSTHNTKASVSRFIAGYISNFSTKEKLGIYNVNENVTTGASNVTARIDGVGKHVQTSNPITSVKAFNDESGDFAIGSEVVVLGWDPADIHTTNFWQQLVFGGTITSGNLSTGTFAAKKYLWIQAWVDPSTSADCNLTINNISASSSYAFRRSINGAADTTQTSQNTMDAESSLSIPMLLNIFMVNNGTNEKIGIANTVRQGTVGAANAPDRREWGFKDSSATQATELDLDLTSGIFGASSLINVYGSD